MSPLDQRMSALAVANGRRSAAAVLKREVAAGLPFADALADPRAGVMTVHRLLVCVPGVGGVTAECVLRRHGLSPVKRVRGLTARQVDALGADPVLARGSRFVRGRAA